jgi:hypothetical protein
MAEHVTLRQRLAELIDHHDGEPTFDPSDDPTLLAFARIFADADLLRFDANKRLRTDALTPIYDCETESQTSAETAPDKFAVTWAPVWKHTDPVTGFRTGRDSSFLGSTPTVAMPQDERTAALLLLVTSTFVHLSASRADGTMVVQGALESDGSGYRFLTLSVTGQPHLAGTNARTALESRL